MQAVTFYNSKYNWREVSFFSLLKISSLCRIG